MYRVLVVDDQEGTASYIRAVLKARGMVATVCGDAQKALETFRTDPHDLVLTDLRMEPMDGLALVRELRAMGTQVPVVVMTGFETLASAGESLRLGVFDYVTKPLDVGELQKTVTRALALSQAMSGSVDLELIVPAHQVWEGLVALDGGMTRTIEAIVRVADHDQSVLLLGEAGSGRHLAAQAIHRRSRRREMPFLHLSEATPAATISGKEFAAKAKAAGTVFLDEITRIPVAVQDAVVNAVPEKAPAPAEGQKPVLLPRLVVSSAGDIAKARQEGLVHAGIEARLAYGSTVAMPPLRERKDDLVPLLYRLLQRERGEGAALPRAEMKVFDLVEQYAWPGNVAELEEAVRAMAKGEKDGCLRAEDLPAAIREGAGTTDEAPGRSLDEEFLKGASLRKFLREAGQRELRSRLEKATGDG